VNVQRSRLSEMFCFMNSEETMCVALGVGCTNCILGQTTAAIDKGATKEEILEALSILLAIRGTTGMAESLRVIKILEEKGMV
jgi:AhpD family alkylhydroperoxidase